MNELEGIWITISTRPAGNRGTFCTFFVVVDIVVAVPGCLADFLRIRTEYPYSVTL